jgi:hypothetical protein
MKEKTLLFKTSKLLLFIFLLVGWSSAWGQTTVTLTKANNSESPWVVPSGVNQITVKIWGAGGGSGGHGTSSATAGGTGGTTTFSGTGATLVAGGGAGSAGATNNTPTAGGAGGNASGGSTITSGFAGIVGIVGGTTSGGDGGASPNGGGTQNGGSAGGNDGSFSGTFGNPPGGGASGSYRAESGGGGGNRRSTGGGGGGAYSEITISVTPGQEFAFAVGEGGAAGTGDQAAGGAGADGQIEITYTEASCIPPAAPTSGGNKSECAEESIQTLTATAIAPAGASVVWYNQAEGGSVVSEPTLSAVGTVTYYAESQSDDDASCVSESRTPVTLTLIAVPLIDDPEDVTACDAYVLPALTVGGAYYASSGGVDPIAVDTEITSTQTIYVYAETGTTPNCSAENSFTVTINTSPELDLSKTDVLCHGGSSGSIDADWSGGADPYAVFLNGAERSTGLSSGPYEITGLAAGTYIVKVEDANGCFDEKTVQITQPDELVAGTLSSSQTICWGELPEKLTGTAPVGGSHVDNLSYEWQYKFAFLSPEDDWTGDGNITTPLEYDFEFTDAPTQTTHYRLQITDKHCNPPQVVYTNEITITVNLLPEAPAAVDVTVTYDGDEHEAGATVEAGEEIIWFADETGSTPAAAPKATNAGTYNAWAATRNITTGCVSATRTEVTLLINKKAITVDITGNPTKFYDGSSTATLEAGDYSIGGLEGSDMVNILQTEGTYASANAGVSIVTVSLVEADFEAIGGTLLSNYILPTSAEGNGTITPLTINVTADSKNKTYGDNDPELTYDYTPNLIGDDEFSGELSREEGENAGTYEIEQGTLELSNNYNLNFTSGTLTVSKAELTVTADDKSKVYGAADPVLTYTPSGTLFYTDDYAVITGVNLSTATGGDATAGTHAIVAEDGTAANYNITHVNGTLTVSKAELTVTADDKSKVYGAADPVLTYTPSGTLFYTDDYAVITGVNLSTATGGDATAGTHAIVAEDGTAANYNITHVNGTLTVSKAELTVTADDKSKVYGAADPVLTYTPSGTLFYTDDYAVITGVNLSTATGGDATAGTHAIVAEDGTAANYNITHVNGTLTVSKAELTVTADDKSKVYGAADPVLTYTPSGTLFYTDDYAVITGVNLSTATGGDATAGTHAIVAEDGTAANYNITHVNGTLTVSKAELTVTADDKSKVYGAADPVLTYTPSGTLFYTDDYAVITGVNLSTATGGDATAGTHAIVAEDGTAANYNITHVNGTLTVSKAELTVTADDKSKVYGAADPVLTYTPSGTLFYTDDYAVITGVNLSTATGGDATAGTHAIVAEDGTAANYNITHVNGTLTVSKAELTVTADDKSKVYGAADPVLTYTPSGTLFYTDDYAVITGVNLSTATGGDATAGTHAIVAEDGTAANYNITHVNGTLTVSKAELTVTADDKSKVYGAADPVLTYTPSGTLFYTDDYAVITGVNLSTATGGDATAGTHAIVAEDGTAANYNITHVNGTLTVSKAELTVTADDKSKVYGAADPVLTYTPSGTLFYTDDYAVITGVNLSTATGGDATAGTHAIVAEDGTAANYNITHVNGTLTVSKAELTVTADDKSKVYGAADPVLTYTPSGTLFYTDDYAVITGVNLSTATGGDATAGTHAIVAEDGTAANYNITHVNGTLTVSKAELTVTADDKSKVYGAADPVLTYTPSGTLFYTDDYAVITGVNLSTATGGDATAGTHAIVAEDGTAANYNITHVNGTLTVSKAELTVTADDKSKVYGAADPVLTYTPSGTLFYTDDYAVITGVNLSTATGGDATAGTHAIVAEDGTAANYNITHVNGTLTVSKAELTVTADDKSKVYGAADPVLTYTPSGTLFYTDDYAVITGVNLSTATGGDATAGTHAIVAEDGTAANYNITHVNGTLTVSKAELTVTADDKSKVYGAADPVLTYTPSGTLFYTDDYAVITGVNLSTATGGDATAGTHAIVAEDGTAANYNITHVNGTLTVSKAELTVTADDKSKVYGAADPVLTYTPSGTLFYTDDYAVITGVNLSTATGGDATAGTHAIVAEDGTAANYNITHVNGTLTVSKAELTVTADDKSKVYGAADPVLTYTPSGTLFYTDDYAVITGVNLSTATGGDATAGTHAIVAEDGTAANYNITHVNGTLTVSKAELTVTADDKSKVYGAADPVLTYTPSGTLFYTDDYAVITGVNLSTATGGDATAGTHAIVAEDGTAANYNITHVNGTLTVSKAELTVTADDKSKVYGAADPVLTYTPSGTLFYTDDYAVITGVNLSTATGGDATAGTHAIVAEDGTAANYNITHVNGTLTVSKAELTVTADDKSKVYGAADPVLTYTPSGTLFYTDDYAVITGVNLSTATGGDATAGTHAIVAEDGTAANYNITHVNGTLTVSKAELTVTADDKSKVYGAADPVLTYTPSGTLFYTDDYAVITGVNLSTATGGDATAGTHAIVAEDGTAANYNITHVNGTLTVSKAELTVTADDKSKVYGAADPVLTYTPSGTLFYTDDYAVITGVNLSTATGGDATAGTHAIVAEDGTAANYNITHVNGTLTVSKAELTVTADDKSKVYGAADPVLTYTPSGTLFYTDDYAVITGVNLSTATGGDATAGTHAIVAEDGTAANYNITHVNGTLTVSRAALTIKADNQTKFYGDPDPELTVSYIEFMYDDDPSVIMGLNISRESGEIVGFYLITASGASADNYNISYQSGILEIKPAPVTASVTVDPTTVQYSDLVTFTATVEGGAPLITNGPQAAMSATFKVNSLVMGTANFIVDGDDLVAVLTDVPMVEPSFGEGTMAPGVKAVTAEINGVDSNYNVDPNPATTSLTITQEDAVIEYVGLQLIATSSSSSSEAFATLRAVIQDNSVTDPDDNWPGDIRNATVQFKVYDVDANNFMLLETSPEMNVVDMIVPGNYLTGIVSLEYTFNIGNNDSQSYGIEIIVNNYYTGHVDKEDLMVTVYKPQGDFITGGGYILPQNPDPTVGLYPSDPGSRTNFGFNVKFNPAGRNLKGRLNFIWRTEGGRILQARSNAIESLGVNIFDQEDKVAVFVAKCNVRDISPNSTALPGSGGLLMYVYMRDRGEPGNQDIIGFTLWNGNELWYSSNWTGMSTDALNLAGGNLVVHSGFNLGEPSKSLLEAPQLLSIERPEDVTLDPESIGLSVFPNPFTDRLNFRFTAHASERALIELYDLTGSRIAVVFDDYVSEGQVYEVEYRPQIHNTTVVFYRMIVGQRVTNGKLIYKE